MLAANEAVAQSFHARNDDTLWRIHDAPDRARLEEFAVLAQNYGIAIDVDEARTPAGLKRVLDRLKGHPAEKPLSFQLLRSLKQATYDVVNLGHFGLASSDYLHFTSPIRRYPDLIVHRLLKSRLAGEGKPAGGFKPPAVAPVPDRAALQKMAADSSFSERAAMEVEREVIDLYRAFFLRDRIGDVFEGAISGVTGFGVFVVVDDPFVEGLVRVDALSDDYYVFDEPSCRLVGRRSGRTFALGDSVKVEVQSVSVVRRKVDFALAGHRARHHDSHGDRYGRRGDKRGRGEKHARREEKHDRARHDRPQARHGQAARQRSGRRTAAGARPPAVATGGGASRRRGDDDIREKLEDDEERVLSPFAQRSRDEQGAGAARAARSGAPDLPARSRSHHPFEGVPAAGGQDAGVPGARGRSLPHAHHPHAGGGADRAHGDAGARPQRVADRGDRHGPRPRPHAVRSRGREGARQADARRLSPRQAVAARGREAGARRAGAEPQRRGARRHPETFEGQGAHHFGQPEPDGDDAGGTDRPHQRHRRLRESRPRRRRPGPGRRSARRCRARSWTCSATRTASGSRAWSTTWCRRRGSRRSGRSG